MRLPCVLDGLGPSRRIGALSLAVGLMTCAEESLSTLQQCGDDAASESRPECVAPCGNGRLDAGEICDGDDVGDSSCDAVGLGSGVVACLPGCQELDVTGCVGCVPACGARVCGPDPVCGASCGECSGVCDELGQCDITPVCPTPQEGYRMQTLGWSPLAFELRLPPGVIATFPIPAPNTAKASVQMRQGQQQMSPGDGISEMSISRCPGVIDNTNAHCYSSTGNGNNHTVSKDAYTKAVYGFTSQETLDWRGCWTPSSEGQWYLNVRWTYENLCWDNPCGYSMQWGTGAY